MKTAWTLKVDGVEKSFADWDVDDQWSIRFVNQGADAFQFSAYGKTDEPQFAYGDPIEVWKDREYDESLPTPVYSAGTRIFVGAIRTIGMEGSGSSELLQYTALNVWHDLERCIFHQVRKAWDSFSETVIDIPTSEVNLGQKITGPGTWNLATVAEQIEEALTWAIGAGAALQLGTIEGTTKTPVNPTRDVMVAEVVRTMLRWVPDTVVYFDYTTTPPTIHVRKSGGLPAYAVDASGNGPISSLRLNPRHDLVLPGVYLKFKQANVFDGAAKLTIIEQKYPPATTGQAIGVLYATIDTQGIQTSYAKADIECAAFTAQSGLMGDRIEWWRKYDQTLRSDRITDIEITSATVTNKNGDAIAPWAYTLTAGALAPWMLNGNDPATGNDMVVAAKAKFKVWTDSSHQHLAEYPQEFQLHATVTGVDIPTGLYSQLTEYLAAEPIPANLAQDIYNAHATLQYDGAITIEEADPVITNLANTLTINGLSFAVTGARIQECVISSTNTQLTIGPAKQLGIADLIELTKVNRARGAWRLNNQQRITGEMSSENAITLGKNTAKENATKGNAIPAATMVSSPVVATQRIAISTDMSSPGSEVLTFATFGATGTPDPTKGVLKIEKSRFEFDGVEVKIREAKVCTPTGDKYCLVLCSAPYDTKKIPGETAVGD